MAKLNVSARREPLFTHEGAKARHITPAQLLRRSVMSCMLWENEFYEDGQSIAERIAELVPQVKAETVAEMAVEARTAMYLRHVPLLLVREMARYNPHKRLVGETLPRVIQRADELTEFLAIYWKDGRVPLAKQVKLGLAEAFKKFDEYALAKYDRNGTVKLRDVLRLVHPKPDNAAQADLWKRTIAGELTTPGTWENRLSASQGKDKRKVWEGALRENAVGGLALLRNLRNMRQEGVDEALVIDALSKMSTRYILPFRFIAAARHAPQWESQIEKKLLESITGKLPGHTVVLVDVSGSMESPLSAKSDMTRMDAACGVAMVAREMCEKVDIYTFSMKLVHVPARHGFALRDAIVQSQEHSGTPLGLAVSSIYGSEHAKNADFGWHGALNVDYRGQGLTPDRLIVITDEQSHDPVPDPQGNGYMINVASARNGVGYGPWTHIDGFSEGVLRYIVALETGLE